MPFLELEERVGWRLGLPGEGGHNRLRVRYPEGRDPEEEGLKGDFASSKNI